MGSRPLRVLITCVVIVAAGCGGGSGEVASSGTTTTSSSAATTTIAPTTTVAPTTSSTSATTSSTTTSSTTTTTLPPVPLVLDGYEAVSIREVCVRVDQSYSNVDDFDAALRAVTTRVLAAIGMSIGESDEECDATLAFDVVGRALSDQYSSESGSITDYSGASYTGSASFTVADVGTRTFQLNGRLDPPFMITDRRAEPSDAPFTAAFAGPLLSVLGEIWGPHAVVEVIDTWPRGDSFDVLTDGSREWVVTVADQVMADLLELTKASSYRVSEPAYEALGEIVAARAVGSSDRSTIVRALIDDVAAGDGYPGQVLRRIAGDDWRAGYEWDDQDNIIGEWGASQWSDWADENGY